MANFNQFSSIIPVDDIVGRIKELQGAGYLYEAEDMDEAEELDEAESEELAELIDLMDRIRGRGGDYQWRGNWYPAFLIRESHFQEYAQELAADCGLLESAASWPLTCIDWEQASRELALSYSCADFRGVTFLFR